MFKNIGFHIEDYFFGDILVQVSESLHLPDHGSQIQQIFRFVSMIFSAKAGLSLT